MACLAIVVLGAVIAVLWVQFGQGAFHDRQQFRILNVTTPTAEDGGGGSGDDQSRSSSAKTHHKKEYIEKTHLEDLGTSNVEFVKPLKISPLPLHDHDIIYDQLHNNHDKPVLRHHSGHFRHKSAELWDPHPQYEIDAFGLKLHLELEYNDKFVAPNLHIVTHGENFAQRVRHDPKISGCFYTGKVKNDPNSDVAVSLCNGMTGFIRTSESNYYIEPAETFTNTTRGSIIHRMKRLPHQTKDLNDIMMGTLDLSESNENRTIIDDDFPAEIVERPHPPAKSHVIRKREIYFDEIDTNVQVNVETLSDFSDEVFRTTREAEWDRSYSKKSNEYFVKVLVVADKTMVDYHKGSEDLIRYILIIMSHVALLYKEATIGNAISLAVVHIRNLENHDFSYSNSQDMLRKFCDWQKRNILERTHDVALLFTRNTICRNYSANNICTTLGVADVKSMCRPGCAIVRDKGLSTSYTIAHELGHVLSMPHDEDEICEQHNIGKTHNIMSKMMKNDTKPFVWSPCSKHFVTEFLNSNRAKCLSYPPSNNQISSNYSNMLPGDTFEANRQCQLEFSARHKICPPESSGEPPCGYLWCMNDEGTCSTQWSPWAEGTKCGPNSWCYGRQCISEDRQQFVPIDGGWGPWQPWSPCSRTCGGGITISERFCDSPRPEFGGSYCIGTSIQYASCNTEDCAPNSNDFRAIQCAQFNGITRNLPNLTNDVQWIPKYGLGSPEQPEEYCKLYCRPVNSGQYYDLKDKVLDGTKCGLNSFDICVNGMCRPGGCDNKLESKIVLDECGICGGDNSRCQEITGTYNKSSDQVGYNRVVRIPKSSSNLNIRQNNYRNTNDENYLVLVDGETGRYILNGNYMLKTQETTVIFDTIIVKYSGTSAATEWITTPRNHKLTKDLVLEVLSVGNLTPPDITYRYLISKDAAPRYGWRLYQKQWSKCNSICEGVQYRKPNCVELVNGNEVHSSYCDNSDIDGVSEKQQCNGHCELTWNIVSKSACSPNCGKGYRHIYYNCMKIFKKKPNYSEIVNEKHCNVLAKPPGSEPCNTICNSTRWDYSNWSECTKTCGGGIQRRTAKCIDNNYMTIDDLHCSSGEKIVEQICNTERCPVWMKGDASTCSAPCGGGYKNITYYCVRGGRIMDSSFCDVSRRPSITEKCNEQPCGRWVPENIYHPCSVTCGKGIERRKFVCKKFNSEEILADEYCRDLPLPKDSRPCYRGECDKLSSYEKRYKFNDINDNSIMVYDRYRTFHWERGEWTTCSQTCGGGVTTQNYHCRNELGNEDELMCDPNLKPQETVHCNNSPCPKWKTGDWTKNCDARCERHRQVRCMDDATPIMDDRRCDITKKPSESTKCKLSECSHITNAISRTYFETNENRDNRYRWKVGAWKQCSNSCGKGIRRRHIDCEDSLNEITVVDSYCGRVRKPKGSKPCERYNCKFAWIESYWSACSASCGSGLKTRNVTCHRVHHGGIVDPVPLPDIYLNKMHHKNYCSVYNKPSGTAKCLLSHCGDEYVWQPEPWKQCSHQCGKKGRQMRILNCVGVRTKQKVPRYYCPKNLKPPRKRICNQWRCMYKSCKEIKHYMRTQENKDYVISVGGRPIQIYCYKMDTSDPQEYISLHPDKMNYAEVYDRRLHDIQSCPYNGIRRDDCRCDQIGSERAGFTKFWKVRVNITSLQIIGDDFTFSKQIKGRRTPYGTAGDCYSSVMGCAQGRFSVDLTYTSFKLSRRVRWNEIGSYASSDIHKTATTANGKCGGYCGNCIPDPDIGLAVEIT